MGLFSNTLPALTFIYPEGDAETIKISERSGQVRACANFLKENYPKGCVVGLCIRTGPELVFWWLGVLLAELKPIILQFPTEKQTQSYWQESISETVSSLNIPIILAEERPFNLIKPELKHLVCLCTLPEPVSNEPFEVNAFSIIQMSSGTTGYKKAVEFTGKDLSVHVEDYNKTLQLTQSDVIVSWLPLYHDMGYIACFVMPLIMGVRTVMMDPETWIKDKSKLYNAIEKFRGTICYMPNFGYEVMSHVAPPDLSCMRYWISCSEPITEETARKFLQHVGHPEEKFSACYAMAENVFAVSQSCGLDTIEIQGRKIVSCGRPIANVQIKILDDEIWIKSPTSITSYLTQEIILDDEGFYQTGDLGHVIEGKVFVWGRKRDLVIQAGRKFLLSDVDNAINQVLPSIRGRVATLSDYDDRLATSKAIVLIEAEDFFSRQDHSVVAENVSDLCGIQYLEISFVPPRFLTKTSSGKINRVITLEDWKNTKSSTRGCVNIDPAGELKTEFANLPFDVPVDQIMDSLALTVLSIILQSAKISFEKDLTICEYIGLINASSPDISDNSITMPVIKIVSLADSRILKRLNVLHLDELSKKLGIRVEVEHICLPPSPILLADLVFADYFLPRVKDQFVYRSVVAQLAKLRSASVILVDDAAELHFPLTQVYPVLSHRLERSHDADYLAFRWQAYVRNHEKLPISVVAGKDLDLVDRQKSLNLLSEYLDTPIVRIATVTSLSMFTEDWDIQLRQSLSGGPGLRPIQPEVLTGHLLEWLTANLSQIKIRKLEPGTQIVRTDLPHFCSHCIDRRALEKVLDLFESFCIAGSSASASCIEKLLGRYGKSFVRVTTPSAVSLSLVSGFECLLICGPTVDIDYDGPIAFIMGGKHGAVMLNSPAHADLTSTRFRRLDYETVEIDWYCPVECSGQTLDVSSIRSARRDAIAERDGRLVLRPNVVRNEYPGFGPKQRADEDFDMSDTSEERKLEVLEKRKEERREARRKERQSERRAEREAERLKSQFGSSKE